LSTRTGLIDTVKSWCNRSRNPWRSALAKRSPTNSRPGMRARTMRSSRPMAYRRTPAHGCAGGRIRVGAYPRSSVDFFLGENVLGHSDGH
jgi:hypothetical protein